MDKKIQSLIDDVQKGKNLVLIKGDELYFKNQAKDEIVNFFMDPSLQDFNYNKFYSSSSSFSDAIMTAMNIPMMSQYRIVVLIFDKPVKELSKNDYLDYLKRIPKETIFIIEDQNGCPASWIQLIKKNGTVYDGKKLYDNQIPDWISRRALNQYNRQVDTQAAILINALAGNNLYVIDQELEKMDIFLKKGETITSDSVKQMAGSTKIFTLFDLGDAYLKNDLYECIRIVHYLLREGGIGLMILGYLNKMIFQIAEIFDLKNQKKTDQEIPGILKIHPFLYKKYRTCISLYTVGHLKKLHFYLTEADILLKSGKNSFTVLESFFIKCLAPIILRRKR